MNDRKHETTSRMYDLVRLYYRGFCQVTRSANQSIPDSTFTNILFDAESYDLVRPNATPMHDLTSNTDRVYARRKGVFTISASIAWGSNSTGVRIAYLQKNGTVNLAQDIKLAVNGFATHQFVGSHAYLNAGDYVTLVVYQSSGGSLNINQVASYSPVLSMALIGD